MYIIALLVHHHVVRSLCVCYRAEIDKKFNNDEWCLVSIGRRFVAKLCPNLHRPHTCIKSLQKWAYSFISKHFYFIINYF